MTSEYVELLPLCMLSWSLLIAVVLCIFTEKAAREAAGEEEEEKEGLGRGVIGGILDLGNPI